MHHFNYINTCVLNIKCMSHTFRCLNIALRAEHTLSCFFQSQEWIIKHMRRAPVMLRFLAALGRIKV